MRVVRLVDITPDDAPAHVKHGTSNMYKNYSCRCGPCSDAGSAWMRDYYRRTHGLTKMIRTGEPIELGSQGGATTYRRTDGSGPRGHKKNATRTSGQVQNRKKKPTVVDFEPDDSSE